MYWSLFSGEGIWYKTLSFINRFCVSAVTLNFKFNYWSYIKKESFLVLFILKRVLKTFFFDVIYYNLIKFYQDDYLNISWNNTPDIKANKFLCCWTNSNNFPPNFQFFSFSHATIFYVWELSGNYPILLPEVKQISSGNI